MAADAGIAHAIPAEGDYPGVSRTSQNEGTYEKIRVQVEHYFSDENIATDVFLLKEIKKNPQGYVALGVLLTFPKLKKMKISIDILREALRQSEHLHINKKGWGVKRIKELPAIPQEVLLKISKTKAKPNAENKGNEHENGERKKVGSNRARIRRGKRLPFGCRLHRAVAEYGFGGSQLIATEIVYQPVRALVYYLDTPKNTGVLSTDNDKERLAFRPKSTKLGVDSGALQVGDEVEIGDIFVNTLNARQRIAQNVRRIATVKERNKKAETAKDGRTFKKYVPLRLRLKAAAEAKKAAEGKRKGLVDRDEKKSKANNGSSKSSKAEGNSDHHNHGGKFAKGPPQDPSIIGFKRSRTVKAPPY